MGHHCSVAVVDDCSDELFRFDVHESFPSLAKARRFEGEVLVESSALQKAEEIWRQEFLGDGGPQDSGLSSRRDPVTRVALKNAEKLMQEHRVLDAEFVLAQALWRLESAGDVHAASSLCKDPAFRSVARHLRPYDAAGVMMDQLSGCKGDTGGFSFVWERQGAKLWMFSPPGATWFRTRIAVPVAASLRHCIAALNELDLTPRWMSKLAAAPETLTTSHRLRQVVRQSQNILMVEVELLYEVMRFANKRFGVLVETMRSDFPQEGIAVPDSGWFTKRVDVDTTSIWLPIGGGSPGTILIQEASFEMGVPVPDSMMHFAVDSAVETFLDDFRRGAAMASAEDADNPWLERLRRDELGLYAALREVELAAEARPAINMEKLPGAEVVRRPYLAAPQQELFARRIREAADAATSGW